MPKSTFFNLSEEKRQRIINATIDEFIENSYENVLISNIAKRSEIPVGSFYQYFHDKDDLYLYLFFELEIRFIEICCKQNIEFRSLKNNESIGKYFSEKELAFYDTWYYVPYDVMRKFYFGEYDNRLFDMCRKTMEKLKEEGKLREDVDFEYLLYLYVTSTFNIYMYCKKNKIEDEKSRLELKDTFFEKIITYGILK